MVLKFYKQRIPFMPQLLLLAFFICYNCFISYVIPIGNGAFSTMLFGRLINAWGGVGSVLL